VSAKCPICGKPVETEFRPFCSARCKQIDLNRWLTEAYRVPDRPGTEDDEAATAPRPGAGGEPEDET
jgi:endogenous inhibitor of DNA gyrase (YacG/DUF329 family)